MKVHHTITDEGRIPHLDMVFGDIEIHAPVRIHKLSSPNLAPTPMRDNNGRLIYALPGGFSITATK